jgi:hypothetical protein
MKKLTLLCLTLALFAFIAGPASAAGPSPDAQAPAAPADAPEPAPGTPSEAPPATAAPDAPAELLGLGLPGDPVPVHGTCGGIQTECRSCPQGIQAPFTRSRSSGRSWTRARPATCSRPARTSRRI